MLIFSLFFSVLAQSNFSPEIPDHHFFVAEKILGAPTTRNTTPTDCRANIFRVVCLVDPLPPGEKGERPCLPGGAPYAQPFEAIHDAFPPALQKVFCSLERIYIENKFNGTAYAGVEEGTGIIVMGVRKSVLDEKLSLARWASWKDQLNFGGAPEGYRVDASLPEVRATSSPGVNDFLYFLVAHEFGHVLDFANQFNAHADPECQPGSDCPMKEGSWGALGWHTGQRPKLDFPLRPRLCFYWCEGNIIAPALSGEAYADLMGHSDFLSLYATRQPWDDFADSLAYYLMAKHLNLKYEIDDKRGNVYDVVAKLRSPVFAERYRFIESTLARPDLRYP